MSKMNLDFQLSHGTTEDCRRNFARIDLRSPVPTKPKQIPTPERRKELLHIINREDKLRLDSGVKR